MKAVVLSEYGGPGKLKYQDWDDPIPAAGEVLVRVAGASINPIDYKLRSGAMRAFFPLELPTILGRDVSGTVRAVGEGVTRFEPGDKVFALANRTYAELCLVKADELARIPEGLDLIAASALPLVAATGEQLIRLGTAIEPGQTVLIAGAIGAVGRVAVRTAKDRGAKVIAGVRSGQLKEAEILGVDAVLALDDAKAMATLGPVDAVADCVGGKTATELLGKVRQGGIFASVLGQPADAVLHPTVTVKPIMAQPDIDGLVKLANDVIAKRLVIPVDRMIALEDAGEGQAAAEKGAHGKIILLA